MLELLSFLVISLLIFLIFLAISIIIMAPWWWVEIKVKWAWPTVEQMKDGLTVVGIFLGAMFFMYKVLAGWMLLNLSVSLDLQRVHSANDKEDYLLIKSKLTKGDVDGMRIQHAELQITPDPEGKLSYKTMRLAEIYRLAVTTAGDVSWDQPDKGNPTLTLALSETLEASQYLKVSREVAYKVEIVVIGSRLNVPILPQTAQWRASAVSVPLPPEAPMTGPNKSYSQTPLEPVQSPH